MPTIVRNSRQQGPNKNRPQCIAINRVNGKRCQRWATAGRGNRLCRLHLTKVKANPELAEALMSEPETGPGRSRDSVREPKNYGPNPEPSIHDLSRAGISTKARSDARRALAKVALAHGAPRTRKIPNYTNFVLNQQSKDALERLGQPFDPTTAHGLDPKIVLLDTVNAAWRQRQVWEAMLNAVPEADWQFLGVTPVPGSPLSSKGARIEAIQKFLSEATKVAARTSKLAIDAGIEERLVRIAEEQSALIADTVRGGLIAGIQVIVMQLRLDPKVEAQLVEAAVQSAANHLRLLAAGGPEVVEGVAEVVTK